MKRISLFALGALLSILPLKADEGMWLPALISQRIGDMQAKGFKLSAEDVYSINQASLKDAVVLFGGGCTGEVVSDEGLLFTNHHCGYSYIQRHSSVEHDYLKDGFWAMSREEELPNRGLSVSFLDHMEEVTNAVLKGYSPRHTGDFSIFRIYADKDNNPADYSEDNVPYRPKKSFTISRAGVKNGDFTFVYGCPGSTKEYVMSEEVKYVSEVSDPQKIDLRTKRLDIMKKYMDADQAVRIQYSSKYANVSNSWKKWQGEAKGIIKMKTVKSKKEYEERFRQWAKGTRYDGLIEKLDVLYAERFPAYLAYEYYSETARAIEILSLASSVKSSLENDGSAISSLAESFFKDYCQPIDEEIFVAMMEAFDKNMDPGMKPQYFKDMMNKYGSAQAWKDDLYSKTVFTDKDKVLALTKDDLAKVEKDPAFEMYNAFYNWYYDDLRPTISRTSNDINLVYRDYMQGQMEFEKDKVFYPDANLTLRVAYGHVDGYSPADGITYEPVSTLKGIIEKDNPEIFDYDIPQALRDIYAEGGHENQPVCFLATNHTSGGNSGSPVINQDGNLIGINFDRVWEGTMSDYVFDPDFCRNISIDIRYLLFNIEYIGHAEYLFNEMKFAD